MEFNCNIVNIVKNKLEKKLYNVYNKNKSISGHGPLIKTGEINLLKVIK